VAHISSCAVETSHFTSALDHSSGLRAVAEVLLVPAGGDVRLGAADWALKTAKVTNLSDERWAWAVEFVSIQWQWAVLTGEVADETDVASQACHRSSMSSTSSVIGLWKQNIVDNDCLPFDCIQLCHVLQSLCLITQVLSWTLLYSFYCMFYAVLLKVAGWRRCILCCQTDSV